MATYASSIPPIPEDGVCVTTLTESGEAVNSVLPYYLGLVEQRSGAPAALKFIGESETDNVTNDLMTACCYSVADQATNSAVLHNESYQYMVTRGMRDIRDADDATVFFDKMEKAFSNRVSARVEAVYDCYVSRTDHIDEHCAGRARTVPSAVGLKAVGGSTDSFMEGNRSVFYHVWATREEAREWIVANRYVWQALFDLRADGIACFYSCLITYRGQYITATLMPQLHSPRQVADFAKLQGSAPNMYAVGELLKALLHTSADIPLNCVASMDGKYYVTNAVQLTSALAIRRDGLPVCYVNQKHSFVARAERFTTNSSKFNMVKTNITMLAQQLVSHCDGLKAKARTTSYLSQTSRHVATMMRTAGLSLAHLYHVRTTVNEVKDSATAVSVVSEAIDVEMLRRAIKELASAELWNRTQLKTNPLLAIGVDQNSASFAVETMNRLAMLVTTRDASFFEQQLLPMLRWKFGCPESFTVPYKDAGYDLSRTLTLISSHLGCAVARGSNRFQRFQPVALQSTVPVVDPLLIACQASPQSHERVCEMLAGTAETAKALLPTKQGLAFAVKYINVTSACRFSNPSLIIKLWKNATDAVWSSVKTALKGMSKNFTSVVCAGLSEGFHLIDRAISDIIATSNTATTKSLLQATHGEVQAAAKMTREEGIPSHCNGDDTFYGCLRKLHAIRVSQESAGLELYSAAIKAYMECESFVHHWNSMEYGEALCGSVIHLNSQKAASSSKGGGGKGGGTVSDDVIKKSLESMKKAEAIAKLKVGSGVQVVVSASINMDRPTSAGSSNTAAGERPGSKESLRSSIQSTSMAGKSKADLLKKAAGGGGNVENTTPTGVDADTLIVAAKAAFLRSVVVAAKIPLCRASINVAVASFAGNCETFGRDDPKSSLALVYLLFVVFTGSRKADTHDEDGIDAPKSSVTVVNDLHALLVKTVDRSAAAQREGWVKAGGVGFYRAIAVSMNMLFTAQQWTVLTVLQRHVEALKFIVDGSKVQKEKLPEVEKTVERVKSIYRLLAKFKLNCLRAVRNRRGICEDQTEPTRRQALLTAYKKEHSHLLVVISSDMFAHNFWARGELYKNMVALVMEELNARNALYGEEQQYFLVIQSSMAS